MTDKKTNRLAAPSKPRLVVVVVDTVRNDLLEVHIGELVGLQTINDSISK